MYKISDHRQFYYIFDVIGFSAFSMINIICLPIFGQGCTKLEREGGKFMFLPKKLSVQNHIWGKRLHFSKIRDLLQIARNKVNKDHLTFRSFLSN